MSKKNKEYDADEFEITPEIEGVFERKEFNKKYQKQQATGIIDPTLKKPELDDNKFIAGKNGPEISEEVKEKIDAILERLGDKGVDAPILDTSELRGEKIFFENSGLSFPEGFEERISAHLESLKDKEPANKKDGIIQSKKFKNNKI